MNVGAAALGGGLLCGTLDGAAAIYFLGRQGIPPIRVWQGIASGLIGPSAFQKGLKTAIAGVLLHFLIALSFALAYCGAAARIPQLVRLPLLTGGLYGIVVFAVMNLIVLPLSARPKRADSLAGVMLQLAIHVAFVGWPIALAASYLSR